MSKELEAALQYAAAGLSVFPVYGKRPITPSGFKDASTDSEIIDAWWSGAPDAGVAIVIPEWAAVVDTDDEECEAALQALDMDLPATLTAITSRGKHYWYRLDRTNETSGLLRKIKHIPSVDILVNGYVVAPPTRLSPHRRREWANEFSVNSISEAPDWVSTVVVQAGKEGGKIDPDRLLDGIEPGQRQVAMFRYACYLRADPKRSKREAKILVRSVADASGSHDYDTDKLVERVWTKYQANEEVEKVFKVWTIGELDKANLPPPKHVVADLLPVGLTTVVSDPKVGKSALMARVSFEIASGKRVLGQYNCEKSGVLYLDLEQDDSPALARWRKIRGMAEWPSNLCTVFEAKRIDDGGFNSLGGFLMDHSDIGVVVIDTLADMWPIDEGDASNVYHRESQIMLKFKRFAKDYGIAVVLIHHNRKDKSGDFLSHVSGSSAITGKSDSVWSLSRERNSADGRLRITGKNIPERDIILRYEKENVRWDFVKEM